MGATISRVLGQGDYAVAAPGAPPPSGVNTGVPSFSPLTTGFRIQHREYIKDIKSSVDFSQSTFYINPGVKDTFPWLSQIAENFEEYKIHGMIVYLNSMSANAVSGTNTALGLWGVCTQYDPNDADFTSKQQAENYVGCQTAVPSQSLIHGIECKPGANVLSKYYLRDVSKTFDSDDQKFYDMGKISVFSQGAQAVSTIGEMWISYDVEFTKPKLVTTSQLAMSDIYYGDAGAAISVFSGAVKDPRSNLGTSLSTNTLTIPGSCPDGVYYVGFEFDNNAALTSGTRPTFGITGSALTAIDLFQTGASTYTNYRYAPGTFTGTGNTNTQVSFSAFYKKAGSTDSTISQSATTPFSGSTKSNVIVAYLGTHWLPVAATAKLTKDDLAWVHKLLASRKIRAILQQELEPGIAEAGEDDEEDIQFDPQRKGTTDTTEYV